MVGVSSWFSLRIQEYEIQEYEIKELYLWKASIELRHNEIQEYKLEMIWLSIYFPLFFVTMEISHLIHKDMIIFTFTEIN